ncbi:26S proteasome regulatory subunit N3 [Cladophialophora yegresii CBS 114405]|uniref:26S proteasome regulatory subunit N3 n=1 Tax=Cladophialophora yegresii CBS 114405 TaxID=1182544 RepID=W9W0B3_9EURO|nr:26S proteasome regulatory subunit N3 [Cladophialophora yegresii CBS 114405]EXJ57941.1 26S proteasome regulatory subunit N3 [Cladophialophora yegresii CBS 114405]
MGGRGRIPRQSTAILNPALSVPSTASSRLTLPAPVCSRCLTRSQNRSLHLRSKRHFSTSKDQQSWAAAVQKIQDTVADVLPSTARPATGHITVDPLKIVAKELKFLSKNIRQLLGSGHPILDTVAKYYTQSEGKHVRPLLVLLMSRATAFAAKQPRPRYDVQHTISRSAIDTPITSPSVLFDKNPDQAHLNATPALSPLMDNPTGGEYAFPNDPSILPSQRRLAEITELIHTASLLHDDVIDHSTTRRSAPSANTTFGNKMAVLAGDFMLGRASVALARLRDPEVTELLATVIANLVEGEFMQLKNTASDEKNPSWSEQTISYYLQKTYLKSASLISKSCRAAALLGQCAPNVVEAAYQYGKNLGLAFQLVDDMLDYTISGTELGKPAGADLELGLATAPLLFAWRDRPELGVLVGRKFAEEGDVQKARDIVSQSDGLEQTRALAQEYADKAISSISSFPAGEAKEGLEEMCVKVMKQCSEEKPQCQRCLKLGVPCPGYKILKARIFELRPSTSSPFESEVDKSSHDYFVHVGHKILAAYQLNSMLFWSRLAPQLGEHHAAVRHGLTALGALQAPVHTVAFRRENKMQSTPQPEITPLAMLHVQKSMHMIRTADPSSLPVEVFLACCLLFTAMQFWTEKTSSATTHVLAANRIMRENLVPGTSARAPGSTMSVEFAAVYIPLLNEMINQHCAFSDDYPPPESGILADHQLDFDVQQIDTVSDKAGLVDAIDRLLTCILRATSETLIPQPLKNKIALALKTLEGRLQELCRAGLLKHDSYDWTHLYLLLQVARVMFLTLSRQDEVGFDGFHAEFAQILAHCRRMLESNAAAPVEKTLSAHLGWVCYRRCSSSLRGVGYQVSVTRL